LQQHEGTDFIPFGSDSTIHAGQDGTIVLVGFDAEGYGNFCILDCGRGWRLWYAHFDSLSVHEGQAVAALDALGRMGDSGNASGAHCHLTLQRIGRGLPGYVVADVIDPAPYLVSWPLFDAIDVSSHNGTLDERGDTRIDWLKAYAAGVKRALIRATFGLAGVDTAFAYNAQQAALAGVQIAFYHTFNSNSDGLAQAHHFQVTIEGLAAPLGWWIDVEAVPGIADPSPAAFTDRLAALLTALPGAGIYAAYSYFDTATLNSRDDLFASRPLWVANWEVAIPRLPRPWRVFKKEYVWWQFGGGSVAGIQTHVDFDRKR
jgi:GH25 family lysozyme M1 (1,4-beta-N-acetylmuramidase)